MFYSEIIVIRASLVVGKSSFLMLTKKSEHRLLDGFDEILGSFSQNNEKNHNNGAC